MISDDPAARGGAIHCAGLSKRFGNAVALDRFDLHVSSGSIISLVGPSGCGKTTALRVIAGFERPDEGTVTIGERVVVGDDVDVPPNKRRVGMVFQDYALFPHMTVAENVGYGLANDLGNRRLAEVLDLVGLVGLGNRMPHELSGGEQQRVALGRALAPGPEVVLLDEPFSNLDARQRDRVRREVRRILSDAEATAIFVTHDQAEALAMADVVAVMRKGQVLQVGEPYDIYRRPEDRWVATFFGDSLILDGDANAQTVNTTLGSFPHQSDLSGPVQVMIRPEWIVPVPDGAGPVQVVDREFYGHDQLLLLEFPDGRRVQARAGHRPFFAPGDQVRIEIDEVVVFPPQRSGRGSTGGG